MNDTTSPVPAKLKLPEVKELFERTFQFYKQHIWLILGISLVPFLSGLALIFSEKISSATLVVSLTVINFILSSLSTLALLDALTGEGGTVETAYRRSAQLIVPFFWIGILTTTAGFGGLILFIIPGIILTVLLSYAPFILLTENRHGVDALVRSWYYIRGYWWAIILRSFVFLIFLIFISFVIGFTNSNVVDLIFETFLFAPLVLIFDYRIYRSLKEIKSPVIGDEEERKIRKNLKIFLTLGIIGVVAFITLLVFLASRYEQFWSVFQGGFMNEVRGIEIPQ